MSHLWITGSSRAACADAAAADNPDISVQCHRRLRGPYTGAGSLMRAMVLDVDARRPGLAQRHAIEILSVAPELEKITGPAPETLTSLAPAQERTRWYSRFRTRRIAHGLVDFLAECAADGPLTLAFGSADDADQTDREFLAIALRRLDPGRVRLIICSRPCELGELGEAIGRHAGHVAAPGTGIRPLGDEAPVKAFVWSECLSEALTGRQAYEQADPALRARLHDERAAELEARNEWSLWLGAIPYHREHGTDPGTAGRKAYAEAVNYCVGMAYYEAGLDLASRYAEIADADADPVTHYTFNALRCQCLALLDRPAETEPIYYDLLARSPDPKRHMNVSYALAMLYTRVFSPEQKDHKKALALVNTAVAIASQLEDPDDRAFHTVFMNNGKALVAMHLGRLDESLRLVNDGIARLDRELAPGKHRLHRSVLHHNRAQVLAGLGRAEEALADFTHVIGVDPAYPEYRFDRGNLLYKLGRYDEAIADYDEAMRLTPPFPELFYNRGEARAAAGDGGGAMSDYQYVLDLEPDFTEARISLATLLLEAGAAEAAAEQVRAGLAVTPDEARLHCTLGLALLELATGPAGYAAAQDAFDQALQLAPDLTEALVNRAVVAYEQGQFDTAVTDLTAALHADPGNPDLLYNRGLAHAAAGRARDAIADYSRALDCTGADRPELLYERGRCHAGLGNDAAARQDLEAHLDCGESSHETEVRSILAGAALRSRVIRQK